MNISVSLLTLMDRTSLLREKQVVKDAQSCALLVLRKKKTSIAHPGRTNKNLCLNRSELRGNRLIDKKQAVQLGEATVFVGITCYCIAKKGWPVAKSICHALRTTDTVIPVVTHKVWNQETLRWLWKPPLWGATPSLAPLKSDVDVSPDRRMQTAFDTKRLGCPSVTTIDFCLHEYVNESSFDQLQLSSCMLTF